MNTQHNTIAFSLILVLFATAGCSDAGLLEADAPRSANASSDHRTQPGAAKADLAAPIHLTFDKSAVAEGVWEGSVGGDVTGDLTTELTALRVAGPVWHVSFNWIIDAGDQSFTAHLEGTLNTRTGRVVMNGTVAEGWLAGARVHEEGQLVDAASSRFQGIIRIMPQTAR